MRAGWQSKPFEDCIEKVTYTAKIQRRDFLDVGAFPVISQEEAFINGYWDNEDDLFRVANPVVVFGDHTKVLKYVDFDFVLGADGVKLLPPKEFLVPKFFYYQLQTAQLDSLGYARHYKLLKELEIKYPDRAEQHRIVAILDAAFDGIATAKANAEQNLQNARALFESHLQKVFTERGEEWTERRLEDVVDAQCSLSYGIVQPGNDFPSGLPVVRPTDLTSKQITLVGLKRIDPKLADGYKRTKLRGGELLLCVRGSTGVTAVTSPELAGANVTRGIVPIVFEPSLLRQEFGYFLMISEMVQSQIRAKTYGAALMQINIGDLRRIAVSFPSLREQDEITIKLEELSTETQRLESLYRQKLVALDELKKSLLHRAFSGALKYLHAMISLDTLNRWLAAPAESEHLEFKEAKQQFDTTKLLRYCVALANEGGGHLVLGVSDRPPRRVVGTQAFAAATDLNDIKARIVDKLHIRVDIAELAHPDGRVLVFEIPSRPQGQPLEIDGAYLMRAGDDLVPMTPDHLRRIFAEGQPDWFAQAAKANASADEVIALLDTQTYFDLSNLPYPMSREGVLARLSGEELIASTPTGWTISNLAAILLAKRLDAFSPTLARKAPRVVIYEGIDKTQTREDKPGNRGYAVGFESLVDFVHSTAPLNRSIEQVVREEVKMFPKQALRELIANALVHQDFLATGVSVMIEMYADRVEISNPGTPPISVERFIDEYRSRNEKLADLMRRLGICEEKGSGVDKVVRAVEAHQLPAPDFRVGEVRTTAMLFSHKDFDAMDRNERIRAAYQHCCLCYVCNQRMTNQTLRERFGLPANKAEAASRTIRDAVAADKIKIADPEQTSLRYRSYIPYWA